MRLFAGAALLVSLSGCPACGSLYRDRADVVVETNISYIEDRNNAHRLDLYEPSGAPPDTTVVVFLHGGYWNSQDKEYYEFATGLYGNVGVALAREGMRVANTNYRLFPANSLSDMLSDVDAAVSFMRQRFPEAPVLLMGHSAGAHLAASAALLTGGPATPVDGLLLLSGVYDIENAVALADEEIVRDIIKPMFGDTIEERAAGTVLDELLTSAIPTLFLRGSDDLPSIVGDHDALDNALDGGETFDFAIADGADHAGVVLQVGSETDAVTPAIVDFYR